MPLRSVSRVVTLLGLVVYVFAIVFRMTVGLIPGKMSVYFGSIRLAMSTLFYRMTLGDDIAVVWNEIWETAEIDEYRVVCYGILIVFFVYVFLSMFTVLNMLIGVLCEVVTAVSAATKEESLIEKVRENLMDVLMEADIEGSGTISEREFQSGAYDPGGLDR